MELNQSAIIWKIALKCAFATIRSATQNSKRVIEVTLYCRAEAQAQNKWGGKQVILSGRRSEEELIGCHNCNETNQSRWTQDLQCCGILCKKKCFLWSITTGFWRLNTINKRQDHLSLLKLICRCIFLYSICCKPLRPIAHGMTQRQ